MISSKEEKIQWYVMRDLKRPNSLLPAYKELGEKGIEIFTPMQWHVTLCQGKRMRQQRPFIPDLLFAHASRAMLDPLVEAIPTLQYRYLRGGKQFEAMSVRHEAMVRFMEAVEQKEKVEYYSYDEVSPGLYGKRIRIIGGRLNGFEGRLMSKRGSKFKRLLVDLQECNLSAAIEVESEYIQLVK